MQELAQGLLRALCFDTSWGYAPTRIELLTHWDAGREPREMGHGSLEALDAALTKLQNEGVVKEIKGRIVFPGSEPILAEHQTREACFPRKLRKARRVARWLSCLEGVRFVALCNTTAQAYARDEGDLDFFIITKPGVIWQTRAWASLPFKLMGGRPGEHEEAQDAVCLSFFVDESALDLSPVCLPQDDPYVRHWFLSLLPLYDRGMMQVFWEANQVVRDRHPFAPQWILSPDVAIDIPRLRLPCLSILESSARSLQEKAFPPSIRQVVNQGTNVIATDRVLKFHVEDGRERFRSRYYEACARHGVAP